MKIMIALLLLFLPAYVWSATVISSVPYDITAAGDYELSGDLSSSTYGVSIQADNVTLDLKGHTLTFGTGNGSDIDGVYSTYNQNNVTIYSSVAGGEIVHGGTGNPAGCNGIYMEEVNSGTIIHDLSITVNSQSDATNQTCGILLKRTINPTIYNVTVNNNASAVVNRHSIPAVGINAQLDTVTASTAVSIHDNTVYTPHWGINLSGSVDGGTGFTAAQVYGNSVTVDQVAANAYALRVDNTSNVSVYGNTVSVSGNGGRGMVLSHADYVDVYSNILTVGENDTEESGWTNGIRMRYGLRYSRVRNNNVTVLCGQGNYKSGRAIYPTSVAGLDLGNPQDVDNEITGNTVTVDNQNSSYACQAIRFGSLDSGHNLTVDGNNITTNDVAFIFAPDSSGYGIASVSISNNKITGTTPAAGVTSYAYHFSDWDYRDMAATISGDNYCGLLSRADVLVDATVGTVDYSFIGDALSICGGSYSGGSGSWQ